LQGRDKGETLLIVIIYNTNSSQSFLFFGNDAGLEKIHVHSTLYCSFATERRHSHYVFRLSRCPDRPVRYCYHDIP